MDPEEPLLLSLALLPIRRLPLRAPDFRRRRFHLQAAVLVSEEGPQEESEGRVDVADIREPTVARLEAPEELGLGP